VLEKLYNRKSIPPFGEPYLGHKNLFRNILDRNPILKEWKKYEPFVSGTTNNVYKVILQDNTLKVLRLWNKNSTKLGILRDCEVINSKIAHRVGLAPEVLYSSIDKNLMVSEFLDGDVLENDDLLNLTTLFDVIKTVKKLHNGPRFVNEFDIFTLMHKFLKICKENNYKLPEGFLEHKKNMFYINKIKKVLKQQKGPTVACHNDILANNIIITNKGIKFIDFEYSGNNDPCYELGHMWIESNLDITKLDHIIREYFGYWDIRNVNKAKLYSIVSSYTWYLWGVIQHNISTNNYNYKKDYEIRYTKANSKLNSKELNNFF
jgi:thiamine kinase-like enzyme